MLMPKVYSEERSDGERGGSSSPRDCSIKSMVDPVSIVIGLSVRSMTVLTGKVTT